MKATAVLTNCTCLKVQYSNCIILTGYTLSCCLLPPHLICTTLLWQAGKLPALLACAAGPALKTQLWYTTLAIP
jgi:hypothetical protein